MKVLKPFVSALSRFRVGDDVPLGTDVRPHSYASLVEGGFIEGEQAVVAALPDVLQADEVDSIIAADADGLKVAIPATAEEPETPDAPLKRASRRGA